MADIAEGNGQHEELRYLRCLLCSTKKPFSGFLSHIRQKHFNYDRYKCTKCAFKCDTEENSIFHSIKKRHDVKEHLAIKIFEDCCRQQIAIQNGMEIQEDVNSGQTKRRRNWNSDSDVHKACVLEKDKKVKTNVAWSSVFVNHEINMQKISKNRNDSTLIPDSTQCLYNEEKQEFGTQITRNILNTADDDSESCKLSKCDDQEPDASELFSVPFANIRSIDSEKLLNIHTILPNEEISESSKNIFGRKKRAVMNNSPLQNTGPGLNTTCQKCGKEVAANYIARKTHALQFHFTQNDDPEIAELLPATIKACFPHSLSWSDYQCTQCGKALGTDRSRRSHVLKEHFYWSAICPISGCTVVINALSDLEGHFKLEHNISKLKIPKSLKQKLRKMQNDRKSDLYRQPSTDIKRKSFTYSSSDTESSSEEGTTSTGTKGKEHAINEKDRTLSTGCSKNMNNLDANVFCRDFYNQETSSDMDGQQLCCTICHSQVLPNV
uniref:C2H2-type domain-containing protein n=1 Tax=Setaria digitata TaxID=48799 RepID=A0A915PH64_9BILA